MMWELDAAACSAPGGVETVNCNKPRVNAIEGASEFGHHDDDPG